MQKLREIRTLRNLSQQFVAEHIGLTRQGYAFYESGKRDPDTETLTKLANLLGVSTDYLLGRDDNDIDRRKKLLIPVLGEVPAGKAIEAIEHVEEYIDLYPKFLEYGELFALKVKGRSMEPDIHNGDIVIVCKQDFVDSGDIAVVRVNGEDVTVKRVKKTQGGIALLPKNPSFEPLYFSDQEIASIPVTIVGKVIEIRRRL